MVQVHVPQGVGVRVPPWAPKHKRLVDENQSAFAFWGHTSKAPARLAGGREGLPLQGQAGSRHVTESLRGHQNIKGWLMKINRPFAFWGSHKQGACARMNFQACCS